MLLSSREIMRFISAPARDINAHVILMNGAEVFYKLYESVEHVFMSQICPKSSDFDSV